MASEDTVQGIMLRRSNLIPDYSPPDCKSYVEAYGSRGGGAILRRNWYRKEAEFVHMPPFGGDFTLFFSASACE